MTSNKTVTVFGALLSPVANFFPNIMLRRFLLIIFYFYRPSHRNFNIVKQRN